MFATFNFHSLVEAEAATVIAECNVVLELAFSSARVTTVNACAVSSWVAIVANVAIWGASAARRQLNDMDVRKIDNIVKRANTCATLPEIRPGRILHGNPDEADHGLAHDHGDAHWDSAHLAREYIERGVPPQDSLFFNDGEVTWLAEVVTSPSPAYFELATRVTTTTDPERPLVLANKAGHVYGFLVPNVLGKTPMYIILDECPHDGCMRFISPGTGDATCVCCKPEHAWAQGSRAASRELNLHQACYSCFTASTLRAAPFYFGSDDASYPKDIKCCNHSRCGRVAISANGSGIFELCFTCMQEDDCSTECL